MWCITTLSAKLTDFTTCFLYSERFFFSCRQRTLLESGSAVFHLQRIPSHVNLKYDDIADGLTKGGTSMPQANEEPLTYLELYSNCKASVNISWKQPPPHPWYLSHCPGASISFKGDRRYQTTFARLSTGHLKCLRFFHGAETL
ncbi:uncharacterized protein TNCT_286851 [Trichonephila clavata]|uniref:Uncharacterized protein n=1 Tax=Trichonephila clavata TaxID=2740835 RepID=A0A8X6JQE7_TRICU|nr:uncharacterized protein TNCT_286851 [Trichonephila clavata]